MTRIDLTPEMEKLISDCMDSGEFSSPAEVVLVGLRSLQSQQNAGDFAPGELDALFAAAEDRMKREGTVSRQQVQERIQQLRIHKYGQNR